MRIVAFIIALMMTMQCTIKKKDKPYNIKLHENLTIGRGEEDLKQIFKFILDITIDKQGNIYVLDTNQGLVRKFDKWGNFLWELNRQGQGPGEFLRIVSLDVDDRGKLYIVDQRKRRIMIYSQEGNFLTEFKVEGGSPLKVALDSKGYIYISFLEGGKDFLLHRFTTDGKLVNSFVKADESEKNPSLRRTKNSIHFCIDNNDNIYVTFMWEYKVQCYSPDGKLVVSWARELPYIPTPPHILRKPNWLEVKGDIITWDIAVDSKNNIYTIWGSRAKENGLIIDIFNSRGNHLGYFYSGIKPGDELQYIDIDHQDNLYIIEPLNEPKVFRFKMSRGLKGKN